MALFTYLIAFGHFTSELLIFGTATINPGVISPCIVASKCQVQTEILDMRNTDRPHRSIFTNLDVPTI